MNSFGSSIRPTTLALTLVLCTSPAAYACNDSPSMLDQACKTLSDTWNQGEDDLYLPFYAYHMRFAYPSSKIDSFREDTWGIGYGRSRYNDSGNWDGLYGMAFLDSHTNIEPITGYGHEWMWGDHDKLHSGLGYTVFVTAREDDGHYGLIPGILPLASVGYDKASVNATYIPGGNGNGNVAFFWLRLGL
ncbi:MAG TPA: lipid IV(A) palmitoyltransferase PagP [Methylophilaceae bacterium]